MTKIDWCKYAVRVRLHDTWVYARHDSGKPMMFGGRTGFARAKRAALAELRAMKWAHMTAVCEVGDEGCPMLHRTAENNFKL